MAIGINITRRGGQETANIAFLRGIVQESLMSCWWIPFKNLIMARIDRALQNDRRKYDS